MPKLVRGYVGIDPGTNGGIVEVRGERIAVHPLARMTTAKVWCLLRDLSRSGSTAVIEKQIPRPTRWFNGKTWVSSILKSTCLLYGSYTKLCGLLVASGLSWSQVEPQEWQRFFGLKRATGEKDSKWKGRLRDTVVSFLPKESPRVTLATSDAVLLALYCKARAEAWPRMTWPIW